MELELVHSKKLLGSSTNQGELFNKTYEIEGFSFRLGELEKMHQLIKDNNIWTTALIQINGAKKGLINYQSLEGLTLFGKQFQNKILIISAGEANRGVYKIYIEGIWKQEKPLT